MEGSGSPEIRSTESKQSPEQKSVENNKYTIFLAGAGGTEKGVNKIKKALAEQNGEENVSVFGSYLSKDRRDPRKFDSIADVIHTNLAKGKKVNVIAHSLGAGELTMALRKLRKKGGVNPQLIPNLEVDLVSPAGFYKGIKDGFAFIGRLGKLGTQYNELSYRTTYHGIDSLTLVPVKGVNNMHDFISDLRKAIPKYSQYEEEIKQTEVDTSIDYGSQLTESEDNRLKVLDADLVSAVQEKKGFTVRRLLRQRGKLLQEYIKGGFGNEKTTIPEETRWSGAAFLGLLSLLQKTVFGRPAKEISLWEKQGMDVKSIIPEYDFLVRKKDLMTSSNKMKELYHRSIMMPLSSHSSFALQPKNLVAALSNV